MSSVPVGDPGKASLSAWVVVPSGLIGVAGRESSTAAEGVDEPTWTEPLGDCGAEESARGDDVSEDSEDGEDRADLDVVEPLLDCLDDVGREDPTDEDGPPEDPEDPTDEDGPPEDPEDPTDEDGPPEDPEDPTDEDGPPEDPEDPTDEDGPPEDPEEAEGPVDPDDAVAAEPVGPTDPVDPDEEPPDEPVVSASATGKPGTTPSPTPNRNASAPTRPMCRGYPIPIPHALVWCWLLGR